MANVAFGVRQTANGIGTTDTDIRHMLAQKWLNKGVVGGLQVSGGSTMAYNVSAGMAICSRGASDGFTEAYFSGGSTPTVEANSSSNPRIDVVWITAHDMSQGDTDNLVTIGVTKGTAAASPSAPTIPTYATELATMLLPGGATSTVSAVVMSPGPRAVPYGSSMGIIAHVVYTANWVGERSWMSLCSATFSLPYERLLRCDVITSMQGVIPDSAWPTDGTMHLRLLVDGVPKMTWERQLATATTVESVPYIEKMAAGTHTITLQGEDGISGWKTFYSTASGDMMWPGQVLIVTDMGSVL
jgi:hypothetical protein